MCTGLELITTILCWRRIGLIFIALWIADTYNAGSLGFNLEILWLSHWTFEGPTKQKDFKGINRIKHISLATIFLMMWATLGTTLTIQEIVAKSGVHTGREIKKDQEILKRSLHSKDIHCYNDLEGVRPSWHCFPLTAGIGIGLVLNKCLKHKQKIYGDIVLSFSVLPFFKLWTCHFNFVFSPQVNFTNTCCCILCVMICRIFIELNAYTFPGHRCVMIEALIVFMFFVWRTSATQ